MEEFTVDRNNIPIISKLKKSDIQYYLFFLVIEFGEALNIGSSNQIFLVFAVIAFLFLVYKVINTKYTTRELFIIIALSILGIMIFLYTKKPGGILSIIAMIGLKEVDIKKVLKLSFYIRLSTFFLLIIFTSFGVIRNTIITNTRGDNEVTRYSMGFSHPNQFHLAFIILLLLCIYIYYQRLNFFHLCFLCLLNISVYFISYSRTSTMIGFIALFLVFWFKKKYFCRLKSVFCKSILPFCFLISIVPVLLYQKLPGIRSIDRLLQWRITFSKHYLNGYPLKLFGNNLSLDPIVLDSGYVELIINYGLIFTFLYFICFVIIVNRYIKRYMYRELLLIICLSIYGITESFIPNLFANLSILFISDIIFQSSTKREVSS